MVQMQPLSSPNIAVTVEVGGGIHNPICQDVVDEGYYKTQDCQPIAVPINNKSTEHLTNQITDNFETVDITDPRRTIVTSQSTREKIMNACRSIMHWQLLADAIITMTVIVLLAIIEFEFIPHNQIGFYCNDPSISFKFTGDTVSIGVLLVGTVAIPMIVMWIIEWMCHNSESYSTMSGCSGSRAKQVWSWYGHYAVGFVALAFICDIMKVVIGEPRPHFFDTCKPREMVNCTDEYVYSYTCTNTDYSYWFVADSSKSFPSGHSALSTFTTIFSMWYLQNRLPSRMITILLKPWLQCCICLWGITCSLTRIGDNRHHWWDVLAGVILGTIFAAFAVKIFCREFCVKGGGVSRALSEPMENGRMNFDDKRHQSVKKLLSNTSVDIPEGRELRDVTASWKE